jgi:Zn-finger nucleic acid-binding protein
MDLTGRAPVYRGVVVRCPQCGDAMRSEPVPRRSVEVDVCDACGGLWLDWFDGEVQALAVEAEAARVDRGTPPPSHLSRPRGGTSACPRCMRPLVPELHRFGDASDDELVNGVELLRCTECVGSFVPRSSAHLLLDRVREPRAATLWEALVALIQRLVGGQSPT